MPLSPTRGLLIPTLLPVVRLLGPGSRGVNGFASPLQHLIISAVISLGCPTQLAAQLIPVIRSHGHSQSDPPQLIVLPDPDPRGPFCCQAAASVLCVAALSLAL